MKLLNERVRHMLVTGELPSPYSKLWAGKGSGRPCTICGDNIESSTMEFESDQQASSSSEPPIVVHQQCLAVWTAEALRLK